VAAHILTVDTQVANGEVIDHTATNARGEVAFLPFGSEAGPRDVLRVAFRCTSDAGLFPPQRARAQDACLVLGVRADEKPVPEAPPAAKPPAPRVPYSVTMITGNDRVPLEVLADSTAGFMRTGVCVLDLSSVTGSPAQFTLEFHAPSGFARAPRVLRIEPNVLPVEQAKTVDREVHTGRGRPDQRLTLDVPGLRFGDGGFVKVEVAGSAFAEWEQRERLIDAAPGDQVYELDAERGEIVFGNGINGAIPPDGMPIYVSYGVSGGAAGNAARGKSWVVRGVSGIFGVNPDPVSGGADAFDDSSRRREARRRVREDHALITSKDIEAAALALPHLEVARAVVLPSSERASSAGSVTLVVMRHRGADARSEDAEPARWLRAIERHLSARMMLGSRLVVRAPKYVDFTVRVRAEAAPSRDPDTIASEIRKAIAQRLVLVDPTGRAKVRELGVGVSRRDIAAWARGVAGVRRLAEIVLFDADGRAVDRLDVPPRGLPRIDLAGSNITGARATTGRGA
jgi:predicted phage baseplate assembly protein